jgi:hypothetical protein
MPSRFTTLRPFVLPIVLSPAIVLALFAAVLSLRHGAVPASLLRVAAGLARDAGADLEIGALRVGWFQQDCRTGLDATGVHVRLPGFDDFQIDINALHACTTHPSFLQGVSVQAAGGARLQVGAVEISAKNAAARDVQVTTPANSTVAVREVSMAQPVFSKQTGVLAIESIDASGVDVRLASAPAPDVCEQAHTVLAAAGPLVDAAGASLARLDRLAARIHRDLIYVALLLAAALFVLKVWASAWTGRWPLRLALGSVAIVVPLIVYALAGSQPLPMLALFALGASALVGGFLYVLVYRQGPRRYERWEPVAVDLASVLIVLPLAGLSLTAITPRAPSSATIARVGVTDIVVAGANDRCGQPQTFSATMKSARIDNIAVGLPAPARDDTVLSIGAAQIPGLSAGLRDASNADIVRILDAMVRADQIKITVDWKDAQLREIDARLRLHASAESPALVDQLRQVRVLAPLVSGLGATDVDVDLQVAGASAAAAGDLERFDAGQSTIAVRARFNIDPRRCALTFASATRVLAPQAKIVAAADGDLSRVEVRSIRTLPGSAVDIVGGTGTLSFGDRPSAHVALAGLGLARGAARVRVASAEMSASTEAQCAPIDRSLTVAMRGADIDTGAGMRARIARTDVRATRRAAPVPQALSLRTRLEDIRFAVRSGDATTATIEGSVPAMLATANGSSGTELIPKRINGAVALSISTSANGELRNVSPLRFAVDVWDGSIAVPYQNQVLLQSIVSAVPADLAFSIAADGRLPSTPTAGDGRLDARVRVPRMAIHSRQPAEVDVRDLYVSVGAGHVAYESGWSSLTLLPGPPPKAFCLEEISRLDLSADGEAKGVAPPRSVLADGVPGIQPCLDLPDVPAERRFKFDGVWPGIRLQGPSGAGVEIRAIDARIQRADLTGGRLRALELDTDLSGIRTLDGGGNLRIATHTAIAETTTRVSSSLFGTNPASLADLTLDASPGLVALAAAPRARTEDIVAAVTPFLTAAGVSLDGVTPKARINSLTADLRFDGPAMTGANARLEVAPGPLASIAFAPERALRSLDVAIAESGTTAAGVFQISLSRTPNAERASVTLSTDVSHVSVHAVDARGADIQTRLDVHADARGALHDAVQPAHPIGTRLSKAAGDFARHVNNAIQVFGPPRAAAPSPLDVGWNLRVHNATPGPPALKIDREAIGLDLTLEPATITWRRTGESDGSALAASGAVGAGLTVHEGQLVLDAYAPLRLEASLPAQPTRTLDGELAMLVAFSDALRPAPPTSSGSGLWDADFYSRFWSGYSVTRAGRARAPLVDSARLVAGPVSVRQIAGPLGPLRIAVGHGERLELFAPFDARALFGTASGFLESAVRWRADQASLDSRFTLHLGNIQAGAVGLDVDAGHVPLVEDEVDADLAVRSDELPLTRETLARANAMKAPAGLDRISLALAVRKSARSQSMPGVLQLSTGMQVNTLNKVLNDVVRGVQMKAPPQTMLYKNVDVNVRVDRGRVATDAPWVTLDGVQLFSDSILALEGTVRLHGGRNGDSLTLDDLLALFIPQ